MSDAKDILSSPQWNRHCRRFHALGRINSALGRELVRAYGGRKSDPELRAWIQELLKLNTELLDRDRRQFEAFADLQQPEVSARAESAPGADALGEAALSVEGEQPDTALAAPPSNLQEVVEATVYCWADESQPCICSNGNDCPRQDPMFRAGAL